MSEQNLSADRQNKKQNFLSCLLSYAREGKRKLILSVVLSVISITAGLVPYYCFYRVLCLFLDGAVSVSGIWCKGAKRMAKMCKKNDNFIKQKTSKK